MPDTHQALRKLLADGKTRQVIEQLLPLTASDRDRHNEVLQLSAQFVELKRQSRLGLGAAADLNSIRNQINHALLQLIDELPEGTKSKKGRYLTCSVTIALASTIVAILGGLAEFTGFSLRNIFQNKPSNELISVTVFVTGKNGLSTQSFRQQGYIVLDLNGERKKELIDDKGQAVFKNLRLGDKVRNLNLEFSEPFKALRPDSVYTIDVSGKIYLEVALEHLGRVYGTVIANDQPLTGVIVSVDGLQDTTDVTGSYSIFIPEPMQRSDPEVKFFKEGYRLEIKKAYPQTNQPLNIVMQKLPTGKR